MCSSCGNRGYACRRVDGGEFPLDCPRIEHPYRRAHSSLCLFAEGRQHKDDVVFVDIIDFFVDYSRKPGKLIVPGSQGLLRPANHVHPIHPLLDRFAPIGPWLDVGVILLSILVPILQDSSSQYLLGGTVPISPTPPNIAGCETVRKSNLQNVDNMNVEIE